MYADTVLLLSNNYNDPKKTEQNVENCCVSIEGQKRIDVCLKITVSILERYNSRDDNMRNIPVNLI